jgi:hypothetical protein
MTGWNVTLYNGLNPVATFEKLTLAEVAEVITHFEGNYRIIIEKDS